MEDYVLGTHDAELHRLGLQAQLWRPQALALWEKAGLRPGQTILDLGCGPGYATLDLARVAGPSGRVVGVDASERFVNHLRSQPPVFDAAPIEASVADVQALELPEGTFDAVWERWCLCFVPKLREALAGVARALKPGGVLVLHEYVNYGCMRLAPQSAAFERIIPAVMESFRMEGGDADVGLRLPTLLAEVGLEVVHLEPVMRLARPTDELWKWPETFFLGYTSLLVERGLISPAERQAFEDDWKAWSLKPEAVFYAPLLIGLIARKKG